MTRVKGRQECERLRANESGQRSLERLVVATAQPPPSRPVQVLNKSLRESAATERKPHLLLLAATSHTMAKGCPISGHAVAASVGRPPPP